jgi:hypothetical protein
MKEWKLKMNFSFIKQLSDTDEDAIRAGKFVAKKLESYKNRILRLGVNEDELDELIFNFSIVADVEDFDNAMDDLYDIADYYGIWIDTLN